jgi:cytidine deaminase
MRLSKDNRRAIVERARLAARKAYCPYSRFRVGACVFARGRFFTGANIENASFGLTICAERTAIFRAVSDGCRNIDAIGVSCVDAETSHEMWRAERMCCGACRQVIAEFAQADTVIVIDGVGEFRLDALLPDAFELRSRL